MFISPQVAATGILQLPLSFPEITYNSTTMAKTKSSFIKAQPVEKPQVIIKTTTTTLSSLGYLLQKMNEHHIKKYVSAAKQQSCLG